jgi:hypothetical protein
MRYGTLLLLYRLVRDYCKSCLPCYSMLDFNSHDISSPTTAGKLLGLVQIKDGVRT